jgi:gamma-glutamylputrescine oxidase
VKRAPRATAMSAFRPASVLAPSAAHVPSYYSATCRERIVAPPLAGDAQADVCIVGGGYTGLSAALHLAKQGADVRLLEQSLLGWGASGRNGGQIHVGFRRDPEWLAARLGEASARALWQLALDAREHLDGLVRDYSIDCDLRAGFLHADHKRRFTADTARHVERMREHWGYAGLSFVAREELSRFVRTDAYYSGYYDARGGHLHALKFALGIARAADSLGARLHEGTEVVSLARRDGLWHVRSASGEVRARQVLLACNGYLRELAPVVERHVMPINNFIAVTEPLGAERARSLIPAGCAVSDSRFVVHYYRVTADDRLLFGGGENYSYHFPHDIAGLVRRHVAAVFPDLGSVPFEYAWGGTLAVTPTRLPFVRELEPGLFNASGFSGLGVVLAPYAGKLVAQAMHGERTEFERLAALPVPSFPGGKALRYPTLVAAMSLFALRDRL